jgi:hypothetical protein
MLTFLDKISADVVGVKVHGRLTEADYERVGRRLEPIARAHNRISVFFELEDCEDRRIDAVLDDVKSGLKRHGDIDSCTIVCGKGVIPNSQFTN